MRENTLAQEFSKKVTEFLASPVAQQNIQKAINERSMGIISRIFNDMSDFSIDTKRSALEELMSAQEKNQINAHLKEIVTSMSQSWVDMTPSDTAGLSLEARESIGEDNYQKLLDLCDNDSKKLANYFLQAAATLYNMVITNQNDEKLGIEVIVLPQGGNMRVDKATKGRLSDEQNAKIAQFGRTLWQPIAEFTVHLNVDTLTSLSIITENQNASEGLVKQYQDWFNIVTTAINNMTKLRDHALLSDNEKARLSQIIDTFNAQSEILETYNEKFDMGLPVNAQDCEMALSQSVQQLSEAALALPKIVLQHSKKTWVDKFWDLVSKITKQDWKTLSSKTADTSKRLAKLPDEVSAEENKSRQTSPTASIDRSDETDYDSDLSEHPRM